MLKEHQFSEHTLKPQGEAIPVLENLLKQNIASFWLVRTIDRDNGGYITDFDRYGKLKPGDHMKGIVSQARMLWFFSKMFNCGYGGSDFLEAAHCGFDFLSQHMWDSGNGGFFWQVDSTGTRSLDRRKDLYGQAFGLIGLTEYYLATQAEKVLDLATELFELLESKAHDSTYGGYVESFNEDWSPLQSGQKSCIGKLADSKSMSTHIHLLDAITSFFKAGRMPLAQNRLQELIAILSNTVVRKDVGACTDDYSIDWTRRPSPVSYGHDLENAWFLLASCKAVGVSQYVLLDLCQALWEYSLNYGYDHKLGGFYSNGPLSKPASDRRKIWWVQAEALVSSLYMHLLTKKPKYLSVFNQTLDFIKNYQVDWENGEWHQLVESTGKAEGDKGGFWKTAYHNGRAMIECLRLLKHSSGF